MKNFNRTQSLEEALKEIADLANEIDLSWFKNK